MEVLILFRFYLKNMIFTKDIILLSIPSGRDQNTVVSNVFISYHHFIFHPYYIAIPCFPIEINFSRRAVCFGCNMSINTFAGSFSGRGRHHISISFIIIIIIVLVYFLFCHCLLRSYVLKFPKFSWQWIRFYLHLLLSLFLLLFYRFNLSYLCLSCFYINIHTRWYFFGYICSEKNRALQEWSTL